MIKKIVHSTTLIMFTLFSQMGYAKSSLVSSFDLMQSEAYSRYSTGNEYISGQEPGVVMMKVNLWGAVRRPGIHHIPVKTNLIELMSFAGGPNDNAILDEVTIKRISGNEQKKIAVDLAEVIHTHKNYDLLLKPDDIIVVPAAKPWVSQDLFMTAMIISVVASTVLSVHLIENR